MRQILSILLLLSVLLSSTGLTMTKHFCGEALAHVSLRDEAKSCCSDEEKEQMPGDCCHDETEQLTLDTFQLDHQTVQLQPLAILTLHVFANIFQVFPENPTVSPLWTAFHSPPLPEIAVYLRVQSFLI
uniref:Uncharacterized protein n=1 Tax=Roseihalotalea indica TaxID=2867963 RepID=A0AA49GUH5_9BACT|nr:hypothetical protein K4G66_07825 [Tunicatimonas sp. TK19036]